MTRSFFLQNDFSSKNNASINTTFPLELAHIEGSQLWSLIRNKVLELTRKPSETSWKYLKVEGPFAVT